MLAFAALPLPPGAAAATSGWLNAALIQAHGVGDSLYPQVAFDGSGNAMAVWQAYDGAKNIIWGARYAVGVGWSSPSIVGNIADAYQPQVAADASGYAIAVWYQSDGTRMNIWANRYTPSWGWGIAGLIETNDTGGATNPQVAVDSSGNALAVWQHFDGTRTNIFANRYTAGSGWGTAGLLETASGTASKPQVAFDSSGNALAVWQQDDSFSTSIFSNRYTAGSGWGNASLVEVDDSNGAADPQVAFDGSGNALAVWDQYDGVRVSIYANRYTAGSGWGSRSLLESDSAGHAYLPQVALDASGNASAVWEQSDGARYNIVANRYTAGSGWGSAGLIETDNTGGAHAPQVAIDASGNALAVWYQFDGTRQSIYANRYAPGSGWGTAALLEADNGGDALGPQIAIDALGNAISVWHHSDGTGYGIWGARFLAIDTVPPVVSLTSPANGTSTNLSTIQVAGFSEPGAQVTVNGLSATVAANGSFRLLVALVPGSNLLVATARDGAGNSATASVNVTYVSPLAALETQVAALQAAMILANASLWSALAAQNASLLASLAAQNASIAQAIADLNVSLLAELAALNDSLLAQLAATDASLLASLAAQNTSLLNQIAQTNASLLAQLAAQNSALTQRIGDLNTSLLAALARQNASLLQQIALTNASLFAALAAQDSALLGALAAQNASLLASMAAGDASLTQLVAATNQTMLAALAALNGSLVDLIARTNASLLASLAAQNSDLLGRISAQHAGLLAALASTNATLWDMLTANDGALWASLNASRDASVAANTGQNSTIAKAQADAAAAQAQAALAQSAATLGTMLGLAGLVVGAVGVMLALRAGRAKSVGAAPPPQAPPPRAPPPRAPPPRPPPSELPE